MSEPEHGKRYRLTGTSDEPSIANGNSWARSEVSQPPLSLLERRLLEFEIAAKQRVLLLQDELAAAEASYHHARIARRRAETDQA